MSCPSLGEFFVEEVVVVRFNPAAVTLEVLAKERVTLLQVDLDPSSMFRLMSGRDLLVN
jgi:hypothetical protein